MQHDDSNYRDCDCEDQRCEHPAGACMDRPIARVRAFGIAHDLCEQCLKNATRMFAVELIQRYETFNQTVSR